MISFLGLDKKIPNSIGKVDRLSSKRMEKRPLPKGKDFSETAVSSKGIELEGELPICSRLNVTIDSFLY